jgi:hypothetical protein
MGGLMVLMIIPVKVLVKSAYLDQVAIPDTCNLWLKLYNKRGDYIFLGEKIKP